MLVKATLPLVGNKKHSLIHNQHKRPNNFLSQFRQHSLPQNRSSCDAKDPYNVIKLKSLQNHNTMRANILFPGSYAGRMSQLLLTILRMKLFMLNMLSTLELDSWPQDDTSLRLHDCQVTITVASAVSGLVAAGPHWRCYVMPSSEPPWPLPSPGRRGRSQAATCAAALALVRPHTNIAVL